MAGAVVDRTWRDAEPDAIEPALAALGRDVASRLPSARAVMSNLVIVRACPAGEAFEPDTFARDLPIDDVAARHPSRVIVIAHEPGCAVARAPIAARVAVSTFGPPAARYSVEQIAVRSACGDESMASIVRRLVRGDLPTSVWWTDDLSEFPAMRSIVAGARQLIYDSRQWHDVPRAVRSLHALVQDLGLDCADLNWRRLAPVHRALRHSLAAPGTIGADRVRIAHRPGDHALAWLLAGWLAGRCGWRGGPMPHVEEAAGTDDLLRVVLGTGAQAVTVSLAENRASVTPADAPRYVLNVPRQDQADAVAAELRTLARNAELHDALRWLAGTIG